MIFKLNENQYDIAKKLFEHLCYQVSILTVLNNDNAGNIWVDSLENPRSAMLVNKIWVITLVGDPSNTEFNSAAFQIIKEEIFPANKNDPLTPNEWIIVFDSTRNTTGKNWKKNLEMEFKDYNVQTITINYYVLEDNLDNQYTEDLPEGFVLKQADLDFLHNSKVEGSQGLIAWIKKSWTDPHRFLKEGFCFYILDENQNKMVSWANADWGTENKVEMSIETKAEYRKRGFASIVAATAVDYCKKKDKPIDLRWFCASHNVASWKTAEKVGFKKFKEFEVMIGDLK